MLDTKTLKNIHNIIDTNDVETVAYIRDEAIKELSRLKLVEASSGVNVREKIDIAINIEIITLAEEKLYGAAVS